VQKINVLAEIDRTRVGDDQIGASLYKLAAGQSSGPYHFHHGVEEWLVVVAGSPTVRTPEGEHLLRAGDTLCFPVGPRGAHEVTGPGTVLIVAENRLPDVVEQPESGTREVRSAFERAGG
jgi:uncharacterized cupin superfamily protein